MKYMILMLIQVYQIFIPKRFRGRCLFRESCSNYIYRVTKEQGFKFGIQAFNYRIKNCRPNYYLTENKGKILLITARNEVLEEELIDKRILIEAQKISM